MTRPSSPSNPSKSTSAKIVVLDDDPMGTQTVHGIPVLTDWSVKALAAELTAPGNCFYVLINTRAFPPERARDLNRQVATNLLLAAEQCGQPFHLVSRSDSTMRGHFPEETDTLAEVMGGGFDATIIVPAFFEAGRVTIDDVHYVADGKKLIPVGETEFARDATFGYRASNLRSWVEEKTRGRVKASDVVSFSLSDVRGDPEALIAKLVRLSGGAVAIVNAAKIDDLHAFTTALRGALAQGKRFLYRTAASFVASFAGVVTRPLLRADEINGTGNGGGLLVVGSHVGKTSLQLEDVLHHAPITPVEISVPKLLTAETRQAEIARAAEQVESLIQAGKNVALFTSRKLVTGDNAAESLVIGQIVSRSLVKAVWALRTRPRWLIGKGGITSSDVATGALGVKRALVLGQALAGIPVWQLGRETRWPGLSYVVFPGNVGERDALTRLVTALSAVSEDSCQAGSLATQT